MELKKREQCEEYLLKRFFFIKRAGGSNIYHDSETGDWTLTKQHLVSNLLHGYDISYADAEQLVSHQQFLPILDRRLFRPDKGRVVKDKGNFYPNLWRPPRANPNPRLSSEPFYQHLIMMLGNKEKANYLIQLLAYKYQRKEGKLHIACYFYGKEGGMGKSLFVDEVLPKVFGEASVISISDPKSLKSKSNVELWTRDWLAIAEADLSLDSAAYTTIKSHTGTSKIDADKKFKDFSLHEIPANLIMLSNNPPSFIEQEDRRFFVSKWQYKFDSPNEKSGYFKIYTDWLFNKGGLEAIAGLLATVKVIIEPTQAAPITDEKIAAMEISVHPAIEEIRCIVETNVDRKLYKLDNFESLFRKHNIVDTKRYSHMLIEAGLAKQPRIRPKVNGKQTYANYFTANGWVLRTQNGKPTVLVRGDVEFDASEDEGWLNNDCSLPYDYEL